MRTLSLCAMDALFCESESFTSEPIFMLPLLRWSEFGDLLRSVWLASTRPPATFRVPSIVRTLVLRNPPTTSRLSPSFSTKTRRHDRQRR